MIQWEKTFWDRKTKELNDLIDITREEVTEDFMKNTYIIIRDARFMEAPWEGKNNMNKETYAIKKTIQKDCSKCIHNKTKLPNEPCFSCMSCMTEYKPKYKER